MRSVKQYLSAIMKGINGPRAVGLFIVAAALVIIAIIPSRSSSKVFGGTPPGTIMSFTTMFGVDDAFVGRTQVRNVRGDELPWEVGTVDGSLTTDGHLQISVTGVVFADYPSVPPPLRGINDEEEFRGLVSCQTPGKGKGDVAIANVITSGFPATRSGDSNINAFVTLPNPCVAPIIFVMSGSEDKWFAVTGAETE